MKKIVGCISIVLTMISCVFAQTTTGTTTISSQIDSEVFHQANAEVQNIQVQFCKEDAKAKTYQVVVGQKQPICIEAKNDSDKDISISLHFVDGTLTNDQRKNRACLDNNQKEKFGQYVTGVDTVFVVPAKGSIQQTATLLYPPSTPAGEILGCIVYYTKGVTLQNTTDFSVLVRKAKFINIILRQSFRQQYTKVFFVGGIFVLLGGIVIFVLMKKKSTSKKK